MPEYETILFGIPVPSDNRIFLGVALHVVLGLGCVICGTVAILSKKGGKIHIRAGQTYFISLTLLYCSIIIASVMRWPHNIHLLAIGTAAFVLMLYGRWQARHKRRNWSRYHTLCMGYSFVLLLTGFYVDNGKNLPFWKLFPQWFFWIFPSVIGIPIILYAFFNHPLNQRPKASKID